MPLKPVIAGFVNVPAAGAGGSGITSLTGDVTASGSGAAAATIAAGAVTDAKASLLVKPAVTVVAVANLTLSGEQTIDGQLTSTSLVLATAQTSGSQNGPWVTAAGAWARPTWYTSASTTQAPRFLTTFVRLGTTYSGSTWRMTTASVTIDTTSTTWVQTPISLATANVTGTLPIANGGTGQANLTSLALTTPDVTTGITSPSSTFALVNVTPTTVNFAGGASTALNIGNASGTTTIRGTTININGSSVLLNSTTTGFSSVTTSNIDLQLNGTVKYRFSGGGLSNITGYQSGSTATGPDVGLFRNAAGVYEIDNATAIGTTLTNARDLMLRTLTGATKTSGTDTTGGDLKLAGGQGYGSGASGAVITQTGLSTGTSSTVASLSTRSYASAKFVDLTESSATLFANIAIASSKYVGAKLVCTIAANDGTDFQALTSDVAIQAVNKGGTVTTTLTQVDSTTAASSGTLSVTYTAVANGNGVDIKANAVSSLTQTVLRVKWAIIALNSDDVGTVTAS